MSARRTALAGSMLVATRLATRLLDLGGLLVLARLLSPADFGIVAIATSVVAVVESALEIPLNQALLRTARLERTHLDTAFTLALLRCLALYGLVLLAVWPIATSYGDPRLFRLVPVMGLGALARGLVSPRLAEYQRGLNFWRDAAIELAGKLAGTGLGILTACLTASYWSVATAALAAPSVTLAASYVLAPYWPRLSLSAVPLFSGFLGWLSLAQVIGTLNWQSERLMLGRVVPITRLGLFTTASDLSQVPIQAVFSPLMRPLLAAFQVVRQDELRRLRSYRLASRAVITIGLPILVGESLVAEPLIRVLLGDRWLDAAPLLRWLAPSLVPALLVLPSLSLVTALGETRDLALRNGLEILVKLPLLWFAYQALGLAGVAVARFGSEAVAAVVCLAVVRRLIGLPIRAQLSDAGPGLVATAVMTAAVLALRLAEGADLAPIAVLAGRVGLGAAVYSATLYGMWRLAGRPAGLEALAVETLSTLRGRLGSRVGRALQSARAG